MTDWNEALQNAVGFLDGPSASSMLAVEYEEFFSGGPGQLERLCRFLGIDAETGTRERYEELVAGHRARRRSDAPLGPEVEAYLEAHGERHLERRVRSAATA